MHEIFERISACNHGSFLPHGAIFKVTRGILAVGDVWALDTSALELQNAETKRTAASNGSKRMRTSCGGQMRTSFKTKGKEGPANLVKSSPYNSSMAISTLKFLLCTQYLRRGDGIIATPDSRRKERLFGSNSGGRTSHGSTGIKLEKVGATYEPCDDTCLKAFVRMLAVNAPESTKYKL